MKLDLKQQTISKWEKQKEVSHKIINRFLLAIKASRKDLDNLKELS